MALLLKYHEGKVRKLQKPLMQLSKIKEIISNREKGIIGDGTSFAVLIPLVEVEGKVNILYELRAKTLKRQPGEISFPGGKIEAGESPKEAAVRETCEELGIKEEDIKLIGEFDTLYGNANFVMYTFVGIIAPNIYENLKLNADEVEKTFLVPLDYLWKNQPELYEFEVLSQPVSDSIFKHKGINQGYTWRKTINETPLYPYGEVPIWGLTGRITMDLIKVLKGEKK